MTKTIGYTMEQVRLQQDPPELTTESLILCSINGQSKVIRLIDLYNYFLSLDNGHEIEVIGDFKLSIQRPNSDLSLYPKIDASNDPDFNLLLTIDPKNNSDDKSLIKIFNEANSTWIDFNSISGGLGTPFDCANVSIDISKFKELGNEFYIRYCWIPENGNRTNYKSFKYPSLTILPSIYDFREDINIIKNSTYPCRITEISENSVTVVRLIYNESTNTWEDGESITIPHYNYQSNQSGS